MYKRQILTCASWKSRSIWAACPICSTSPGCPSAYSRCTARDVYKRQKLDSSHIEFVMECLHNNTTEVRNIKQYLLTVLFNAPTTMNNHYTAQVNHDMHAGGW